MKKLTVLTLIIIAFLSGIITTCFATHDSTLIRDIEARKAYEAACIYKSVIKTFIENYESLADADPNGDWQMHANNMDELYYEIIDGVECSNKPHLITNKELRDKFDEKIW